MAARPATPGLVEDNLLVDVCSNMVGTALSAWLLVASTRLMRFQVHLTDTCRVLRFGIPRTKGQSPLLTPLKRTIPPARLWLRHHRYDLRHHILRLLLLVYEGPSNGPRILLGFGVGYLSDGPWLGCDSSATPPKREH